MDQPVPVRGEEGFSWAVWPVRQEPLRALGLGLLVVGFSAYCLFSFDHWLYAVAALVILALGAHSTLFPSVYSVEADGMRVKHLTSSRFIPWGKLACYLRTDEFVALSTTTPPTHRSISDGLILRLSGNADQVAEALSAHLPEYRPGA